MMATDSRPLTFSDLVQRLREWAATPTTTDQPERLDISLFKSGSTVHQVDFQPKTTFKGAMKLD